MKKLAAAVLSIIICLAILFAIDGIGKVNNRQAHRVEESWDHRYQIEKELCKKIQTEIRFLFDHDWAGEYFLGDGLSNIFLFVAPESGYMFIRSGDLGLWAGLFGAISESNGRISFVVANKKKFENRMKMYKGTATNDFAENTEVKAEIDLNSDHQWVPLYNQFIIIIFY